MEKVYAEDWPLWISRLLSYTVVAVSLILKLPQVIALLRSKNTKGVDLRACWMSVGGCLIGFSYGYIHGYHITTYMEAGVVAVQTAVIVFLVIYYNEQWTVENGVYTIISLVFITVSYLKLVPHPLLRILLLSTLPLTIFSKWAQINAIYKIKSRGNVSLLTWCLDAYTCFARLFTVYMEVGDLQIFVTILIAFIMNCVVIFLCVFYSDRAQKKAI